jgi:uncharacterized membrane protein
MVDNDTTAEDQRRLLRIEGFLGGLLRYGALVASGWIALGMALNLIGGGALPSLIAERCLAVGIVLLIALPVLRVALMAVVFLFEKDYRFAAIAGAVLAIIVLGFFLGRINSDVMVH